MAPDTTSTHPKIINDSFKEFYNGLYAAEADISELRAFLDRLNIPKIDPEAKEGLEATVTCEEVSQAINAMCSGRAAGPDGFPQESIHLSQ